MLIVFITTFLKIKEIHRLILGFWAGFLPACQHCPPHPLRILGASVTPDPGSPGTEAAAPSGGADFLSPHLLPCRLTCSIYRGRSLRLLLA